MCVVLTLLAVPLSRLRPAAGALRAGVARRRDLLRVLEPISAGKVWIARGTVPRVARAVVDARGRRPAGAGGRSSARACWRACATGCARHEHPRPLHRPLHPRRRAAGDGRAARCWARCSCSSTSRTTSASGTTRRSSALWFTLLNLPQQAFELLPITALIGSLLGLGSLARGSELTVIRATGHLRSRASAGTALMAGDAAHRRGGAAGRVSGSAAAARRAKEQKAFSKFTNISFGGGGGAWVRDGNLILNVARQSGQRQFGGMQIFELSPDHTPARDRSRRPRHRGRQPALAAERLHRVALHAMTA